MSINRQASIEQLVSADSTVSNGYGQKCIRIFHVITEPLSLPTEQNCANRAHLKLHALVVCHFIPSYITANLCSQDLIFANVSTSVTW